MYRFHIISFLSSLVSPAYLNYLLLPRRMRYAINLTHVMSWKSEIHFGSVFEVQLPSSLGRFGAITAWRVVGRSWRSVSGVNNDSSSPRQPNSDSESNSASESSSETFVSWELSITGWESLFGWLIEFMMGTSWGSWIGLLLYSCGRYVMGLIGAPDMTFDLLLDIEDL